MSFLNNWLTKKSKDDGPSIFGEIMKTMREGVIVINPESRITASNAKAYEYFGRGNGPLENKSLAEVFRDLSIHEAFRSIFEGEDQAEVKFEFSKRNFEVRISRFEENAIGFFYDTTQVERLEKIRQEFLSNVSHELRTPLTSILAFVETLEDGAIDDSENNRRFLEVIRKNAERMHHLIDDISELSSIESGAIKLDIISVSLKSLVNEIFTSLSGKAPGIRLVNEVADGSIILADRFRLEQMLTNLIDNAIKFNSPKGSVFVSLTEDEWRSVISVRDTGEGIAAEYLPRLFERFYRIDKARSREIGGTGLGLAIVKHLALLHGGEVSIESAPGKGSTFKIELPVSQSSMGG